MRIEAGQSYRTRDGRRVTISQIVPNSQLLPYPATGQIDGEIICRSWTADGMWTNDGRSSARDLVARWDDATDYPGPQARGTASSQPTKFRVGGQYRMRDGRRVTVTEIEPGVPYPVIGRVDGARETRTWTRNGQYMARPALLLYDTNGLDLVGPWEDSPVPAFHLEVGRWYKTRGGRDACVDGGGPVVFHGHIAVDLGPSTVCGLVYWWADGHVTNVNHGAKPYHPDDLVRLLDTHAMPTDWQIIGVDRAAQSGGAVNGPDLVIRSGRYYRTRGDQKAYIAGILPPDVRDRFPVLGVICTRLGRWMGSSWQLDGRAGTHGEHPDDIVAEWRDLAPTPDPTPIAEPIAFDWSQLPKWANAGIIQEPSGRWYCWPRKPLFDPAGWLNVSNNIAVAMPDNLWPTYSGRWQDSWTPNPTLTMPAPVPVAKPVAVEADYDWSKLPAWATCIYRLLSGIWVWATLSPTLDKERHTGWCHITSDVVLGTIPQDWVPKADVPWDRSLTLRPTGR